MTRNAILYLTAAACGLLSGTRSLQGTLITIQSTAEVTVVSDEYGFLEGKIDVGDTVTGRYIYDTASPDLDPSPQKGDYEFHNPPSGISLEVGGVEFKTDPDNLDLRVLVQNDLCWIGGCFDSFSLHSSDNLPLHNGVPVTEIDLGLVGYTTAISSDVLPTTAPVWDSWESGRISIWGGYARQGFHLEGRWTSAVLIPEPATIVLLGVGALALLRTGMSAARERRERYCP